jgi:O-antigen/teichoic acid export membrane protein
LAVSALLITWIVILVAYDLQRGGQILSALHNVRPSHALFDLLGSSHEFRSELRLLWLTVPLAVTMALGSLEQNIPRYIIEREMDLKSLGLFSAMAYLMIAGSTLVGTFNQAASPRLAIYYSANDKKSFMRLMVRMSVFGCASGLVGILIAVFIGRELLASFYTPEYSVSHTAFVWLMVTGLCLNMCSCLGTSVTAMRIFKVQAAIHVLIVITVCSACWLLVKPYGLDGIALGLMVGMIVGAFAYWLVTLAGLRKLSAMVPLNLPQSV